MRIFKISLIKRIQYLNMLYFLENKIINIII